MQPSNPDPPSTGNRRRHQQPRRTSSHGRRNAGRAGRWDILVNNGAAATTEPFGEITEAESGLSFRGQREGVCSTGCSLPGEHLAGGNHTAARRAQNAIFWCHPNHQHHHQIAAHSVRFWCASTPKALADCVRPSNRLRGDRAPSAADYVRASGRPRGQLIALDRPDRGGMRRRVGVPGFPWSSVGGERLGGPGPEGR